MSPFPFTDSSPIEHGGGLPSHVDVVVIGGGVIGVSTTLFLARSGVSTLLLEKGRVAGEQSSRNWGWIRVQGRDEAEIPIALESQRLWQQLATELDTDIHLRSTGVAYLSDEDSKLVGFAQWAEMAKTYGLNSQVLDGQGIGQLMPASRTRWKGGLWTASDMRAEPFVAIPALARLAVQAGAQIRESTAVRMLDIEAGQVAGVLTERGRVQASSVVLAGGSWSSLLLRRHGISIPQLSVRATVVKTQPVQDVFSGGAVDHRLAFRRRADGGYTLAPAGFHELFIGPDAFRALTRCLPQLQADPMGTRYLPWSPSGYPDAWFTARRWQGDQVSPFERMRVLNPEPNFAKVAEVTRRFTETFPSLGQVDAAQSWAGMIDGMPDMVPVVDTVNQTPGLTVLTGMCGHGFGIGPAFGRIASDLVQGRDTGHDLSRFRLQRFLDGSKLVMGPNL